MITTLGISNVSLADRLRELRREVHELEIKHAAERGEGWEADILKAQPKPRAIDEDDITAAIEGRPLAPPRTAEVDTRRLLIAKRAAVRRLAAEDYARQVRVIQTDYDERAHELEALVRANAKVLKALPEAGQAAVRLLLELEHLEHARDSVRVEGDGVSLPPLSRADGDVFEVARCIVRIGELAEAAEKVLRERRAA